MKLKFEKKLSIIQAYLSKILKESYIQRVIAYRLGITQVAVSKYQTELRGYSDNILPGDIAETLTKNKDNNDLQSLAVSLALKWDKADNISLYERRSKEWGW